MKKSGIVILTIVIGFIQTGFTQKLVSTKINDRVSLQLSENLTPVPDNELQTHFPSSQKPLAAYINEDGKVKFSISISANQWVGSDVVVLKDMYKSTIMSLFDQVEFLQEKITPIRKRDFIVFEFVSELKPEKKSTYKTSLKNYSYIQYTLVKESLVIFNFTCPESYKANWQSVTKSMMGSIRIK